MFKDTKDGQTHYYGDGCGEPAHNPTKKIARKYPKIQKQKLDKINNHNYFEVDFVNPVATSNI